ncbi:MAG TPA: hypothetical protein VHO46_13815 [Bacteroidales bacterium]|nr:hypothetical protein [Bacteroidales bacterium]
MNNDSGSGKKRNTNRDVFVFAFFVLISFIFWYLNSLDKEVEATIRLPVRYTNIPRGRIVSAEDPERLNLYVKGTGSAVLRRKMSGRKNPVTIDISKVNYKRVPGSKEPDYYIITSSLSRSFRVQLRSEFEITSVKPDTLFFRLQRADEKTDSENRKASQKQNKS